MRAILVCMLFFGAACLGASATGYGPAPSLTKTQSRRMGEAASAHIVMRQLGDILVPADFPHGGVPTRPLSQMWFRTTPRSAGVDGLCTYDAVVVGFDPIEPVRGADTQVRATSISTSRYFRFLEPPPSEGPAWIDTDRRREANSDCARAEPGRNQFFAAPSEYDAALGYWLAYAALDQLEETDTPFPLACDARIPCAALIDAARLEPLSALQRCGHFNCIVATFGSVDLEISFDMSLPARITQVKAREFIIVADSRID